MTLFTEIPSIQPVEVNCIIQILLYQLRNPTAHPGICILMVQCCESPAVVDLPTPPFPEETATMCFTPSIPDPVLGGAGGGGIGLRGMCVA